eukprot:CAMPEP_0198256148 /NCGR_PEP_ID=MMETSP1447-20131203/6135_1 /TAXON_ID=420782 /ORGANISM="Chaetoceros dichaeta, Strain CCMP1751" /LENGTH=120 /DNA_ID=CAMNT_0043942721 /DNA_START=13 /DNA_END=375 /DNA_ORIENTATION=-
MMSMMKVSITVFLIVTTAIIGMDNASAFIHHPLINNVQSFSHLYQEGVHQLPSAIIDIKPSTAVIRKAVTTRLNMAGARKKLSEMTEEEKIAEKEQGDLLLKAKGAAFVVAVLAFYLTQQ